MPSPRPAPAPPRRGTGGRREVLLVLLVGLVVLLTALAGPVANRWHDPPAWLDLDVAAPTMHATEPPPVADGQAPAAQHAVPGWLVGTLRAVALAALAVVLVLLVRFVVRAVRDRWRAIDRGGADDEAGGTEVTGELDELARAALGEGVARAGAALRDDLPPGDAVVAAWLALERAAAQCGVDRDPVQTATEFTLALLDRTPADPAAARRLLDLYHAARFSEHAIGPAEVGAARTALDTLGTGLARAVAGPDGPDAEQDGPDAGPTAPAGSSS